MCRTADNRVCVLAIPKAEPGERWRRLFRGDSDGARCMQPPYALTGAGRGRGGRGAGAVRLPARQQLLALPPRPRQPPLLTRTLLHPETEGEVLLEAELPFWTEPCDVSVTFGERQLAVDVRNGLQLRRTYWRNKWVVSLKCNRRESVAGLLGGWLGGWVVRRSRLHWWCPHMPAGLPGSLARLQQQQGWPACPPHPRTCL